MNRPLLGLDAQAAPVSLACVVLAHTDPTHVRRLVAALAPFPVFLHCDPKTPSIVFAEMTTDLPDRCVVLDRFRTGWARWENVAAEIDGYRMALQTTSATHIALLTGSDYPLASTAEVNSVLEAYRGRSIARVVPLPHPDWGKSGGYDRLRYRHWAFRKHMLRLPVPRSLPQNIRFAGGSQLKILAREHARAVVDTADRSPELVKFWKRSWVADESFIPSILSTAEYVPNWAESHIGITPWWIGWDGSRRKSPPWLDMQNLDQLMSRQNYGPEEVPKLFARKFNTESSTSVLDAIDQRLRNPGARIS